MTQAVLLDIDQQKIVKWQKSIEVIIKDIQDLLYSRQQIRNLESIIKSNLFVKDNIGSFWEHYKLNYLFFAVSKVGQQIDDDIRSVSLTNLLNDLINNNQILTMNWWTKGSSLFDKNFKDNFGKFGYLDACVVCSDINMLKLNTQAVKKLRNKRVAHKDKSNNIESSISGKELDIAIDCIEILAIKYNMLLTGACTDSLIAADDSWKIAFTKRWVE